MNLLTIILIALGLAMDSLAVSVTCGSCHDCRKYKHSLKLAGIFGLFHIAMPIIGWLAGVPFKNEISFLDHWIALVVLSFIGIKMMLESFKPVREDCFNINRTRVIISLAFATSIDALMVGVTFAFIEINIWCVSILFGIINFIITFAGNRAGNKYKHLLGSRAELLGGLVLIILGIKIFFEHVL